MARYFRSKTIIKEVDEGETIVTRSTLDKKPLLFSD